MENAAKALTIAGTILISLIVISALIFMFREIRGIKSQDASNQKTQQIIDFNKSYESYDKTLYGSELLSLASKIEDYNRRYIVSDGYQPIKLIIGSGISASDFPNELIQQHGFDSNDASKILMEYRNYIEEILMKYYKSSNNLEALHEANGIIKNTSNITTSDQYTRADYQIDQIAKKIGKDRTEILNRVENDYKNYQKYENLKTDKNKFTCNEIKYDNGNGRITSMKFSK